MQDALLKTTGVVSGPMRGYSITPASQSPTITGNGVETDVTGTYSGASSG